MKSDPLASPEAPYRRVTAEEVASARTPALLLDVRTPGEFRQAHITGAVLHPLSGLDPTWVAEQSRDKAACVVVCQSGGRAARAAEMLALAGVPHLEVLDGGLNAWMAACLPVVHQGRGVISLERQVRIGAGVLVLTGSLLGVLLHPGWFLLPGGVGVGLVFAGMTDWCGMGLLLARMPWNRN